MNSSKTKTLLLLAVVVFMGGCHGCTKPKAEEKSDDSPPKSDEAQGFFVSAEQIFATANYFSYQSEMNVITKKGASSEADFEAIDIKGAKPRVWLRKRIDSQHFLEVMADGDIYFVKSGGKEFRRGSDNTPLYKNLIDDGMNLLETLLTDFELKERVALKHNSSDKKIYEMAPGPVSQTAPFVQALLSGTPNFGDVIASDASGSFTVDQKSGLPISGTVSLSISGKEERSFTVRASFNLELRSSGEPFAMPVVKDEEIANYPVDIGRRFNDLFNAKESKSP